MRSGCEWRDGDTILEDYEKFWRLLNKDHHGSFLLWKKFKESYSFFSLKTFLGASPPPLGLPPYCDDAVTPNLMKYFEFS